MDYSLLIAYLRQKQYITDLEKDVLDTWDELQKSPFDRSSAQLTIETGGMTLIRHLLRS